MLGSRVTDRSCTSSGSLRRTSRYPVARRRLDSCLLSRELAGELEAPLRIGIGIHVGTAVVGLVRTSETQALQFLGDTGNIAAKLEAKSKDLGCTVVVSLAALNWVVQHASWLEPHAVAIPGKSDTIKIAAFNYRGELERVLAA